MEEIKDGLTQEKVEPSYSFEDINKIPEKESELGKEEKNSGNEGKYWRRIRLSIQSSLKTDLYGNGWWA